MQEITAFKTTDGKIFEVFDKASEHQKYLAIKPELDLFTNSPYCKYNNQAQRKIVENTILAWKAWCDK
jgi:hypothetical protein